MSSRFTCPDSCPLKNKGCYADNAPLSWHFDRLTKEERGISWDDLCDEIKKLPEETMWRFNVAGDLPNGAGGNETIDHDKVKQLIEAGRHTQPFTYTHKPVLGDTAIAEANRQAISGANANGFTINLSADSLEEADEMLALGIGPVTTVLPSSVVADGKPGRIETPSGHRVVVCPATYRDGISCKDCKLCAWSDRQVIIGFPAHGSQKKKVDRRLESGDVLSVRGPVPARDVNRVGDGVETMEVTHGKA